MINDFNDQISCDHLSTAQPNFKVRLVLKGHQIDALGNRSNQVKVLPLGLPDCSVQHWQPNFVALQSGGQMIPRI